MNGLITQFSKKPSGTSSGTIYFQVLFSNAKYQISSAINTSGSSNSTIQFNFFGLYNNGFSYNGRYNGGAASDAFCWIAVGY